MTSTDWGAWHRAYDDPGSDLSRRRRSVQAALRDWVSRSPDGPLRIVSACAGDGRDLLEVLAEQPDPERFAARLLETDEALAGKAEALARRHGLAGVDVVRADAGVTESYAGAVPADLVMLCGVFGNLTDDDARWTIETARHLCAPGAFVVWTRGRFRDQNGGAEPTDALRAWFAEAGFEQVSLDKPADSVYRVGVHRLVAPPEPLVLGRQLFTFTR
ncbi:MAG: class I SAM-dependent methyltransferase [Nocardioides sp.]